MNENNAKILDEIKAAVGEAKPLSLANRFPFASAATLNDIEDYAIESGNKREDECIASLLKAVGLKERPPELKNFEEVCEFVVAKIEDKCLSDVEEMVE